MSQSPSIVTSNRAFHLGSQSRGERLYNSGSDEDSVTGKVEGSGRDGEEDLDSLRGTTGSAVGTTTIIEEEEIETITTFEGPPDLMSLTRGEEDSSSIVSHRSYISGGDSSSVDHHHSLHNYHQHSYSHQELSTNNYDLNLSGSVKSVPFPELGVNVVDINYHSLFPSEKSSSSSNETRLTDVKSWEDNWLFQKKKKKREEEEELMSVNSTQFALTDLHLVDGPVNMYIPNPSQSESFLEHFPLEDLEELSERGSVISLAFSTDSEEEKLLIAEPEEKIEKTETNSAIDLLEEQISSLKIQTNGNNASKSEKTKEDHSNSQKPSSGFMQFLMTHDSSGISYDLSPKTTLKTSSFIKGEGRSNKSTDNAVKKNGPPITSSEPQVSEPPLFIPLNRRITECPKSDPCFILKPLGASVQPNIVVQFCCRVKGSRPIQVAWFKGDQLMKNDETFRIFSSGNEFVLEVTGTKINHTDSYSCCVYNSVGQQWTDFQLEVKEVKEPEKIDSPPPVSLPSSLDYSLNQITSKIKIRKARVSNSPTYRHKSAPIAIITRTWAERNEFLSSPSQDNRGRVRKEDESKSNPVRNSMTSNVQVPSSGTSNMGEEMRGDSIISIGKGVPKIDSVNSDRPIVYSSTPTLNCDSMKGNESNANPFFGKLKLGDQREELQRMSSIEVEGEKKNKKVVSNETESGSINSIHKKDYSVPSYDAVSLDGSMERNRLDESMNGLEEKVYESSKFFTLRHPPSKQELIALASIRGRSSTGESGCESISFIKGSSQDEQDDVESDERDAERIKPVKSISPSAVGPSVRKLVRRFSRKESGLERRSTFTSSNSIHDEGRGSGIRVQLRSPGSHRFEVPFELRTWNKSRNRRRTHSCTFSSSSSSSSDFDHNSCFEIGGSHSLNTNACIPFSRSHIARSISNDNFYLDSGRPIQLPVHVHSLTARNMKKDQRDEKKKHLPQPLNRGGSMSLYDIDQHPKSLSPGSGSSDMTTTTDSPTNDGYISDDSTVSGTKVKFSSHKVEPVYPVDIHASRVITRTVTEKATFWQKRTDNGLSQSVNDDFPNAHFL